MKAWWQNLAARERQLVMLGAGLIGLTLLWLLVWKPLASHHRLLQQDLADAQTANADMQSRRAEILSLRGAGTPNPVVTGGSLHTAVIETLKQYQLDGEGTTSEENDKNTVNLKLEGKPFDALVQFLASVETQQAAHATRLTLKPAAKPGTVDAQITLER